MLNSKDIRESQKYKSGTTETEIKCFDKNHLKLTRERDEEN